MVLGEVDQWTEGVVVVKKKKARPEDSKVCALCGEIIIGDYDYVRTRRRAELYFHKGMMCRREENGRDKREQEKRDPKYP